MSPRKKTETVSFRADEDLLRLLDNVRHRFGISRGEWVRATVQAELLQTRQESADIRWAEIDRGLEQINVSLESIAKNQARALFAVLTLVGQMPADEAKQLIRAQFKNK